MKNFKTLGIIIIFLVLVLLLSNKKTDNWMAKESPEIGSQKLEKLGYAKLPGETSEQHVKRERELADLAYSAGY